MCLRGQNFILIPDRIIQDLLNGALRVSWLEYTKVIGIEKWKALETLNGM